MEEIKMEDTVVSRIPPGNYALVIQSLDGTIMLAIGEKGTYVRGVKVERSEQEAKEMFDTIIEWMREVNLIK